MVRPGPRGRPVQRVSKVPLGQPGLLDPRGPKATRASPVHKVQLVPKALSARVVQPARKALLVQRVPKGRRVIQALLARKGQSV